MPQTVCGAGWAPLKPGSRAAVAELASQFDGWLEWDQFELRDDLLVYAYNDTVTIGTAGDLDDFLDEVAEHHAATGWAHYGDEDDISYYGPTERMKLDAEISELESQVKATQEALAAAVAKRAAQTPE